MIKLKNLLENVLTESSGDKLYAYQDGSALRLFLTHSPNSGTMMDITGLKGFTSEDNSYDTNILYSWAAKSKPFKKGKTKDLYKIPNYGKKYDSIGSDDKELDIWGGSFKPKQWIYLAFNKPGGKYNIITIFDNPGEATAWLKY